MFLRLVSFNQEIGDFVEEDFSALSRGFRQKASWVVLMSRDGKGIETMLNKLIDLIRAYEKAEAIYLEEVKTRGDLARSSLALDAVSAGICLNRALKDHEVIWYNGKGYASDLEGGVLVFTSLIAIPGMDDDVTQLEQQRDEARQIVRNVAKRLIGVNEDARRAVAQWNKEDLRS